MGTSVDTTRKIALAVALGVTTLCGATGCTGGGQSHVRKAALISVGVFPSEDLIAQTIEALEDGGEAVGGLHDYHQAQSVAYAGLGQLEGVYSVSTDAESRETAMFLLCRAWVGVSFAFIMDAYERSTEIRDNEVETEYQARRARAGFARARWYGEQLLERQHPGFAKAQKNIDTLHAYLDRELDDPEIAEQLMWLGYAWIGRIAIDVDNAEVVSELWVGVELLRHVIKLDPTVNDGSAHIILGAYHARSGLAELDEAKMHFDKAMEISGGKMLATKVNLAARYYCMKRDKKNWERELREVLASGDVLPKQRLTNAIAKRQARRYLSHKVWQEPCAFD